MRAHNLRPRAPGRRPLRHRPETPRESRRTCSAVVPRQTPVHACHAAAGGGSPCRSGVAGSRTRARRAHRDARRWLPAPVRRLRRPPGPDRPVVVLPGRRKFRVERDSHEKAWDARLSVRTNPESVLTLSAINSLARSQVVAVGGGTTVPATTRSGAAVAATSAAAQPGCGRNRRPTSGFGRGSSRRHPRCVPPPHLHPRAERGRRRTARRGLQQQPRPLRRRRPRRRCRALPPAVRGLPRGIAATHQGGRASELRRRRSCKHEGVRPGLSMPKREMPWRRCRRGPRRSRGGRPDAGATSAHASPV